MLYCPPPSYIRFRFPFETPPANKIQVACTGEGNVYCYTTTYIGHDLPPYETWSDYKTVGECRKEEPLVHFVIGGKPVAVTQNDLRKFTPDQLAKVIYAANQAPVDQQPKSIFGYVKKDGQFVEAPPLVAPPMKKSWNKRHRPSSDNDGYTTPIGIGHSRGLVHTLLLSAMGGNMLSTMAQIKRSLQPHKNNGPR